MEFSSNMEKGPLQTSRDYGTSTEVFTINQELAIRFENNKTSKISNGSSRFNIIDIAMLASGALSILDTSIPSSSTAVSNSEDQFPMKDSQRTKEDNLSLLYEIEVMTTFLQTLEHITEDLIKNMHSIDDELCQVEYIMDRIYQTVQYINNLFAFDTRPKPNLLPLEWKVCDLGNSIMEELSVLGDDIRDHLVQVNSVGMEFVKIAEEFALLPIESSLHIAGERVRLNARVQEICLVSTRNLDVFLNFQADEFDHAVRYNTLENEIEKFDSMYVLLMSLQSKESTSKQHILTATK